MSRSWVRIPPSAHPPCLIPSYTVYTLPHRCLSLNGFWPFFCLLLSTALYLLVTARRQKWWRLKYRFEGKSKTIGLGVYPEVSLREARLRRDEARTMIARGIDPARKRKGEHPEKKSIPLSELANEWFENMKRSWRESYARTIHYRVSCYILPEFGNRDIREIQTSQIYDLVKKVEKMGKVSQPSSGIPSQTPRKTQIHHPPSGP